MVSGVTFGEEPECGPEPSDHATIADWVNGLYVRRCVHCPWMVRA